MQEEDDKEDDDYEERELSDQQHELTEEMMEMIAQIEQDPEFEKEFLEFLAEISKDNFDLSALQTKILLLIKPIIEKAYIGKDKKKKMEELKKERENLRNKVRDISFYFTMKKASKYMNIPENLNLPEDRRAFLNDKSTQALKAEMKRHAIYEIYKMTNPRKIAGETRKDNFVGNYITKGEKQARKYEGGTEKEVQIYKEQGLTKKLGRSRKKFISRGGFI